MVNIETYSPASGRWIKEDGGIVNVANIISGNADAAGSPGADRTAFGLSRVASPTTIFDSSQEYSYQPLLFEHVTAGTGVATYVGAQNSTTLTTGGALTGARAMRQTKVYWRYQPGKGQLVKMTGVPVLSGSLSGGAETRMGYFSDNNGIYFAATATGPVFRIRSDTSGSPVDVTAPQESWNIDTFDGNGPSGITLDVTKSQIVVIDFQWLSVGRVRAGFQIDGILYYAHEFVHANIIQGPYMRTANLPLRYEVVNNGAGSNVTMQAICCAVESEGGVQDVPGYTFRAGTAGVQVACPNAAPLTPIFSMRLVDLFQGRTYRGHVKLVNLESLASNFPAYYEVIWNATLTGATWANSADATYSGVEVDTAATAVTGGVSVEAGYFGAGAGTTKLSSSAGISAKLILARTYANVRDTITLAARGVGGTSNVAATIDFTELY